MASKFSTNGCCCTGCLRRERKRNGDTVKVKIGVNGADGVQWPLLKEKAAKEGIEIELIEFSDYTLPNNALANGDLDINSFQHIAFLGQYTKESGEELIPIGSTMLHQWASTLKKLKIFPN